MMERQKTIGMPRSLLYFKHFPLWKPFLEDLGCDIITSPKTNKTIVERGVEIGFNELCLPVKVYYGHVVHLLEHHPNLDYMFVPRYVSLEPRGYYCPKFLSLPDAMRGNFEVLRRNAPRIIEWEVNAKRAMKDAWAIAVGRQLGASTARTIEAYKKAVASYKAFKTVVRSGVLFSKALDAVERGHPLPEPSITPRHPTSIFVLGHPYNVYEEFTNMNMLDKMEQMGVNVLALENLSLDHAGKRVMVGGRFENYWGHEQEVLQAAQHLLNGGRGSIDGVIFVISFACGPDSLIAEVVMRDMQARHVPYMSLVIDEHSGSAGMLTRIETFVEMIKRRKLAGGDN